MKRLDDAGQLARFLSGKEFVEVDWGTDPWRSALPCLRWLGAVSDLGTRCPGPRSLSKPAAAVLAGPMASRFLSESGEPAWSSDFIGTALEAMGTSTASVPEPLLRAVWTMMADVQLGDLSYQFSRAFGRELLGRYPGHPEWDLGWMTAKAEHSQLVFRYWTIGVKSELWNDELEREVQRVLGPLGFAT